MARAKCNGKTGGATATAGSSAGARLSSVMMEAGHTKQGLGCNGQGQVTMGSQGKDGGCQSAGKAGSGKAGASCEFVNIGGNGITAVAGHSGSGCWSKAWGNIINGSGNEGQRVKLQWRS